MASAVFLHSISVATYHSLELTTDHIKHFPATDLLLMTTSVLLPHYLAGNQILASFSSITGARASAAVLTWPAESHEYEGEQKIVTSNAGYLAAVQKYKEQVAAAIQSDE